MELVSKTRKSERKSLGNAEAEFEFGLNHDCNRHLWRWIIIVITLNENVLYRQFGPHILLYVFMCVCCSQYSKFMVELCVCKTSVRCTYRIYLIRYIVVIHFIEIESREDFADSFLSNVRSKRLYKIQAVWAQCGSSPSSFGRAQFHTYTWNTLLFVLMYSNRFISSPISRRFTSFAGFSSCFRVWTHKHTAKEWKNEEEKEITGEIQLISDTEIIESDMNT